MLRLNRSIVFKLKTASPVRIPIRNSSVSTTSETMMRLGDLKAQGLANWTPPGLLESLMEYIHVSGSMSWGLTIVATTLAARVLIAPVFISAQRTIVKLQKIAPEVQEAAMHMKAASMLGDLEKQREYSAKMMKIYSDNNVHPLAGFKSIVISGPIMCSFFIALQDIAALNLPALQSGGYLWFTNLNVPDPYFVLPLLASASFLYVAERGLEAPSQQSKNMKNVFRGLAVIGFPFMATFPAALSLYWFTNSVFTIAFTKFVRLERVSRIFNIPSVKASSIVVNPSKSEMPSFKESLTSVIDVVNSQNPDHPLVKKLTRKQKSDRKQASG